MQLSDMDELINQLKKDIIEALSLEDVVPEDFDADTPLFCGRTRS